MKTVPKFVMAAVVLGAAYWLLHPLLWQDERPTWVAALAWGGWMAAVGLWSEHRQRSGKSLDSPAATLASGLVLTGIGIVCFLAPTRPGGSPLYLSGLVMTGLGLFCLGSGFKAWRTRSAGTTDTLGSAP